MMCAARWGVRIALVILVGLLGACGGCDEPTRDSEPAGPIELGPPPEDVGVPGDIYKDAFEKAKEELDVDGARDRLREIERDVVREREQLE